MHAAAVAVKVQATAACSCHLQNANPGLRPQAQLTSSTGALKAASSLCSVEAASALLQLRMKRSGGGAFLG